MPIDREFDYVIMSDIVGLVQDVQSCFQQLNKVTNRHSRVIVTHYNKLWYPVIAAAEALGFKSSAGIQNWLSISDIESLRVKRTDKFKTALLVSSLCAVVFIAIVAATWDMSIDLDRPLMY